MVKYKIMDYSLFIAMDKMEHDLRHPKSLDYRFVTEI